MVRARAVLAAATAMTVGALASSAAGQQFTPFTDRGRLGLEGNWQSCIEHDGRYAERIYDGRWPGFEPFELHLGPYHDFALFHGSDDEHRDHESADNLLDPHTVEVVQNRAAHVWETDEFRFEVSLSGGSRDECESWFIRLTPRTSSSR